MSGRLPRDRRRTRPRSWIAAAVASVLLGLAASPGTPLGSPVPTLDTALSVFKPGRPFGGNRHDRT